MLIKTKLTELHNDISDISCLATKTALIAVENKIPSVSSLVKKTNYGIKIRELEKELAHHNHGKYITTPEFITLAAGIFNAKLAQVSLVTKTDFDAICQVVTEKLPQVNQNTYLLKMS